METHLPYSAPDNFVKSFAPILRDEREAHDFLRVFNTQALHWITPMAEPFSSLEAQTLSDMYDAEVAYQDHVLAQLLTVLDEPEHRDNTMVIFVADHGEVLGEHLMMGHAFGVYQELIRVLLLIRFPGQMNGKRITAPVSATRLFHTVLDVAGVEEYETHYSPAVDVRSRSLTRESSQPDKASPVVFSEAYAPEHALKITETYKPDLIEPFNCRVCQWAVYQDGHKLVKVEDVYDEVFAVEASSPLEIRRLDDEAQRERMRDMKGQLKLFLEKAQAHRLDVGAPGKTDLENEMVRQRLRNLGYLE
jgi:arylsulfatase A-like enzyme